MSGENRSLLPATNLIFTLIYLYIYSYLPLSLLIFTASVHIYFNVGLSITAQVLFHQYTSRHTLTKSTLSLRSCYDRTTSKLRSTYDYATTELRPYYDFSTTFRNDNRVIYAVRVWERLGRRGTRQRNIPQPRQPESNVPNPSEEI